MVCTIDTILSLNARGIFRTQELFVLGVGGLRIISLMAGCIYGFCTKIPTTDLQDQYMLYGSGMAKILELRSESSIELLCNATLLSFCTTPRIARYPVLRKVTAWFDIRCTITQIPFARFFIDRDGCSTIVVAILGKE